MLDIQNEKRYIYLFFLQGLPLCSLPDEQCLKTISEKESGCLQSCSGLHADVQRINENMKSSFQNVAEVLQTGKIFTEKTVFDFILTSCRQIVR